MRSRNIKRGAILTVGGLLFATCAGAQDRGVAFAGGDAGEDSSAYLGVTWAMPASELGTGWAVRGLASVGRYDYRGGAGPVEADFRQADVVLLRQASGAWGYFNVGAGVRITDTDLNPVDPGNARQGSHWDGVVTADGARDAGAWRVGGFAVYGVRMREYFLRGEVTHRLGSGPFRAGAEILADGDETYNRRGAGAVLTYQRDSRLGMRAAVGERDGDPYVSVGITRTF